jgi:hypothetical protein
LRVRRGDTEVAAQCQLQSSAHTAAADRGDDGLLARLDDGDDGRQRGLGARLRRGEFTDVCAAREQSSGAGQDDRVYRRIALRAVESFDDARSQRMVHAVDRRIVERDHRHRPMQRVPGTHRHFPLRRCYRPRAALTSGS